MIRGSCLCGGVRFELTRAVGPFELCHCSRCRKVTGSAFAPAIGVRREDFRYLSGQELVAIYDAPILDAPPAYRSCFCRRCGSPVPDPGSTSPWFEIAAGLLDDDPLLRPARHIMVDYKADWYPIDDGLPMLDRAALIAFRDGRDSAHASASAGAEASAEASAAASAPDRMATDATGASSEAARGQTGKQQNN